MPQAILLLKCACVKAEQLCIISIDSSSDNFISLCFSNIYRHTGKILISDPLPLSHSVLPPDSNGLAPLLYFIMALEVAIPISKTSSNGV